jgi:hypothetical protein
MNCLEAVAACSSERKENQTMQIIIGIDPGPEKSAYVVLYNGAIQDKGKVDNAILKVELRQWEGSDVQMAIEMVASYGMPVGCEIFETVFWIGRVWEAAERSNLDCRKVYRKDIKLWLCNSIRAKDANVRQALLDKFPRTGGGKTPQIGTKSKPGPLYGMSGDIWSALAIALYAQTYPSVVE